MTWRKAKDLEFIGEDPPNGNSSSGGQPSDEEVAAMRQKMREAAPEDLDLHLGGDEQSKSGKAWLETEQPRVIRRYANRRLFDTQTGKYVTLPEVAEIVETGAKISVIDHDGKTDLTAATLSQIVRWKQQPVRVVHVEELRGSRPSIEVQKELEPPPRSVWN